MVSRRFPLLPQGTLPWSLIASHDAQARANHDGQSLERLAVRGGLSAAEALAVIEDRPFRPMDDREARMILLRMTMTDHEWMRFRALESQGFMRTREVNDGDMGSTTDGDAAREHTVVEAGTDATGTR